MLCRNERVSEDGQLPDGIQLKDVNILTFYKLFGISFRNESHFKSAMCLSGLALVKIWMVRVRRAMGEPERRNGLQYTGTKPVTPRGYSMSYALYVRQ